MVRENEGKNDNTRTHEKERERIEHALKKEKVMSC